MAGSNATNYKQLKVKSILRKEYIMADVSTCIRPNTVGTVGVMPVDRYRNNAKFLCEHYDCMEVADGVFRHVLTCGVDVVMPLEQGAKAQITLGTRYIQYGSKVNGKKLTLLYPLYPVDERRTEKMLQQQSGNVNALPVYYKLDAHTYVARIQVEQNINTGAIVKANLTVHTSGAEGTDVYVKRVGLNDAMTYQLLSSLYAQIVKRGIFYTPAELKLR